MMKLLKSFAVILILFSTVITGCSSKDNDELDNGGSNIISPNISINEQYYRGVLPYKRSPINGTLVEIPDKLDSNHFELALIELAKKLYDPAVYIFEEGQVLTPTDIDPLINPEENTEFDGFVYAITEHDYLLVDGNFAGMVVGVVVNPQYYEKDENGEYRKDIFGAKIRKEYTEEELTQKSKLLINELVTIIRNKTDVPIYFGVMKAENTDMKIPGTFFLSGNVLYGEKSVSKYNLVNERYMFLPSDITELDEGDIEIARGFNQFRQDIDEYIPRFTGITGLVRFEENNLVEITLEIYTEFESTVEVIQLTQLSIDKIAKYFPAKTQINLYISTINKPRAIYVKNADGEDFMHIYRN